MSKVINEYVAMREKDHEQAKRSGRQLARREGTSEAMLRQIKRVVRFWHKHCGKTPVEKIDNGVLQNFIAWRKDYYHSMPASEVPKGARLNPTDKTLQWELTLGKAILKYAHERGYRGTKPLPTYTYQAEKKIVRPAFTSAEYLAVRKGIGSWIKEAPNEKWRQTRLLQPMRNRLRFGWSAKGEHGYHGYAFRHKLREANLDVWCHDDAQDNSTLDIETVEAEVVF